MKKTEGVGIKVAYKRKRELACGAFWATWDGFQDKGQGGLFLPAPKCPMNDLAPIRILALARVKTAPDHMRIAQTIYMASVLAPMRRHVTVRKELPDSDTRDSDTRIILDFEQELSVLSLEGLERERGTHHSLYSAQPPTCAKGRGLSCCFFFPVVPLAFFVLLPIQDHAGI